MQAHSEMRFILHNLIEVASKKGQGKYTENLKQAKLTGYCLNEAEPNIKWHLFYIFVYRWT